jgi:hypothetical protein
MPPGSRSTWTEADLDPSVKKTCEKKSMKKKIQEFIKIFKYHFERFIRKNVYMEFFFFNIYTLDPDPYERFWDPGSG